MREKDTLPRELIHDGIRFLRSLTEVYGVDEGMKIWNKMGDAIGPNLHGQIFFEMLGGNSGRSLHMSAAHAEFNGNTVPVIKCIRQYTGLGLKEAKDIWDRSKHTLEEIECDPRIISSFIVDLRKLGCAVS